MHWSGRAKAAPPLPIVAATGPNSIVSALRKAMLVGKATAMEGKDTVDLIKAEHLTTKGVIVLLFHRTSPNATDPAYRKVVADGIQVRQSKKDDDEDQVMSCHLVISTDKGMDGGYSAVLEEIPGLSATTVLNIVRRVLHDFSYPYTLRKKEFETNTTFKAVGIKSESLTDALKKKGSLDTLILTRTAPSNVPDGKGIAEPQSERVRYKIVGDPSSADWRTKFNDFVEGTKGTWDHVAIEIQLEDTRHRTVRVDRKAEAAEILFVRSELAYFDNDLPPCSTNVVLRIVDAAAKLIDSK
jgi:hypothetical protein